MYWAPDDVAIHWYPRVIIYECCTTCGCHNGRLVRAPKERVGVAHYDEHVVQHVIMSTSYNVRNAATLEQYTFHACITRKYRAIGYINKTARVRVTNCSQTASLIS